jgi:hypothetical protein
MFLETFFLTPKKNNTWNAKNPNTFSKTFLLFSNLLPKHLKKINLCSYAKTTMRSVITIIHESNLGQNNKFTPIKSLRKDSLSVLRKT